MLCTLKLRYRVLTTRHRFLKRLQERHAVLNNRNVAFYVTIKNYVMDVDRAAVNKDNLAIGEIVMSALENIRSGNTVQNGLLMQLYERFFHFR